MRRLECSEAKRQRIQEINEGKKKDNKEYVSPRNQVGDIKRNMYYTWHRTGEKLKIDTKGTGKLFYGSAWEEVRKEDTSPEGREGSGKIFIQFRGKIGGNTPEKGRKEEIIITEIEEEKRPLKC